MALTNPRKGLALVFFTALVSGVSIFVNSFGVKGFDSSVFTFSKNTAVAIFLFSLIMGFGKARELLTLEPRDWGWLALIGLVGGSIPFLLFFKGLQMTTGTASAFIHKTLFIYVAVFAGLFLKERPTPRFLAGAVMILLGTYFFIRPSMSLSAGHLLVFLATLLWAAENTMAKKAVSRMSGTTTAFGRMFFGSLFILAFLAATGKISLVFKMSLAQYSWILVTAAFLLLYVLSYYNALSHIPVSVASSVLALGAPITAVLAWAFRGSQISPGKAAGMLLIAAGVALAASYTASREAAGLGANA